MHNDERGEKKEREAVIKERGEASGISGLCQLTMHKSWIFLLAQNLI